MAKATKSTTTRKPTTARKSTAAGRTTKRAPTTAAKAAPETAAPTGADTATDTGADTAAATPVAASAPASAPGGSVVSLVSDAPTEADAPDQTAGDGKFRRSDLLDAVAKRTDLKRPQVKEIMDLILEELGASVERADTLVLPPMGKVMVKGRKETGSAKMLTIKLRRQGAQQSDPVDRTGLADSDGEG